MKKLILVLGSPNDDKGNLGQIALDRLNVAINIYTFNDNCKILCTGGFGEHFNRTDTPHGIYAQRYLIKNGINQADLLEIIPSENSVEDLRLSKPIIQEINSDILLIVTSDFHMRRIKILSKLIIQYPTIIYCPAVSTIPKNQLEVLTMHENQAIKKLEENNFILY